MSKNIAYYLPLYLGCETNRGKFIGINQQAIFIQSAEGNIIEHDITHADFIIKPYLKNLDNLSGNESSELIKKGMNIGRPKCYSFSIEAFLYLLALNVDLFGLIGLGLALDIDDVKNDLNSETL